MGDPADPDFAPSDHSANHMAFAIMEAFSEKTEEAAEK
jgi:hypothetical protein